MKSPWESWICQNNKLLPNEAMKTPYKKLKSRKLKKVYYEHNLLLKKGNTLVSSSPQLNTFVGGLNR